MAFLSDTRPVDARRGTLLLAILAHAVVWIVAGVLWPRLPERFPTHFDFAGNPDHFSERSGLAFFALPALTSLITAIVLGVACGIEWLATAHPDWINTPNKQKFLRLDAARRRRVVSPVKNTLESIAIYLNGLFLYILIGTERVANGAWQTLPGWPSLVLVGLVLATVIVQAISAHRRVNDLALET